MVYEFDIPGLQMHELDTFTDERGVLVPSLRDIEFDAKESYTSITWPGFGRGMHYQDGQAKMVVLIDGYITDYVIDLRRDSPTYLHYAELTLSSQIRRALVIPANCAHGFIAREKSVVQYFMNTKFESWKYKGINMRCITDEVMNLSNKDATLPIINVKGRVY